MNLFHDAPPAFCQKTLHRFDGDYVDQNGVALTDEGGTLVLEAHGDVRAHSA